MGVKEIINGIFFLEGADDTQKSLGKVIIALGCIMYNVGECYRVQKREAVNMFFDIFPVYISILLQAIARVIAFSMFFASTRGSNSEETVTFLCVHILAIFAINLCFSRHWHGWRLRTKGKYELGKRVFVDLVAAVCSSLVYSNIRLLPMADERKEEEKHSTGGGEVYCLPHTHCFGTHPNKGGIFYSHFFFYVLVLVENVILTAWEAIQSWGYPGVTYNVFHLVQHN